jgi:hypothetical protein
MRECEQREVHILDTSYDTVKVMLAYLYTGDAPLTPASAFAVHTYTHTHTHTRLLQSLNRALVEL